MSKSYLCDNRLSFHCPGCELGHGVPVDGSRGWVWNQNLEKPTLSPSILVTYPANPDAAEEFKEWRTKRICHSFVTDGRIQFLNDCTHELAGQTVDLPDWDY